jgi:hypothetical protein
MKPKYDPGAQTKITHRTIKPVRMLKAEWDKLALEMVQLKHRLGEAELWLTMHAMDVALKQIGWEIAGHMERERKERT